MRSRMSNRTAMLLAAIAGALPMMVAGMHAEPGAARERAARHAAAAPTSSAQSLEGCWAGTLGSGAQQRRGVLQVTARTGGGYAGRMHTFVRTVNTDFLLPIRVEGDSVQFAIAGETGRIFRGRLEGEVIAGEMTRRGSDGVYPFQFVRTAGEDARGRALLGNWGGTLQAGAVPLRVVYKVVEAPCGQVLITMDSPDQGQMDLPVTGFRATADSVVLEHAYLGAVFRGVLAQDRQRIGGVWTQGPSTLPLALERSDSAFVLRRPQHPEPPFPYDEEEVTYRNEEAGLAFAGTLTLPRGAGPFPAVLLITGSGAQNRDEELMGHRPFLVIADHLTRRGIAVLRVDDRGVGGSEGVLLESTIADNAGDALAAVAFLKRHPRIDAARIGLVGHSEGGWVAPLAAARSPDVRFIVTLAGPAVSGAELLRQQDSAMAAAAGRSMEDIRGAREESSRIFAVVKREPDADAARREIRERLRAHFDSLPPAARQAVVDELGENPDSALVAQLQVALTPWFRHLLTYDPRPHFRQIRIPILALYGDLDVQVPAALNAAELERVLRASNHPDFTVNVFPGLNHLFQHAQTGLIDEYGTIEETFAPEALEMMAEWIARKTGAAGAAARSR